MIAKRNIAFLVSAIFLISFASSLTTSQWDYVATGTINNSYYNNTYVNQSNTFNSTQFETGEPITIKTSWLTSFIESVVNAMTNFFKKGENIEMQQMNLTNVSIFQLNEMSGACYPLVCGGFCKNATATYYNSSDC